MEYEIKDLPEISVIGKEGLCTAGHNIVQSLWAEANAHFGEVAGLGMKDDKGYVGFWGAMSDETMSFRPWTEGFTRGLYLAGVEVTGDKEAPEGWTKWTLPARRYIIADVPEGKYGEVFSEYVNEIIPGAGMRLSGAACDFTEPSTGRNKLFFPVEEA